MTPRGRSARDPFAIGPSRATAQATARARATALATAPALALALTLVLATGMMAPTEVRSADQVLVGAGDIADCATTTDSATATLLDGIGGTVFALGDNAYPAGASADFRDCYGPTWGRHKTRTRPAPGNHEYRTGGATGYFDYFGSAAGTRGKGWYSYDLGAWHIVVLNSNCTEVGGCGATSPQATWLRADLAANAGKDVLAYWHHPRFSSGKHGPDPSVGAFWEILYAAGADVVLNGHDHDYERFVRQDPWGRSDPDFGIRQFVVGTGGAELRPKAVTSTNSAAFSATFGVLKLTLRAGAYDWSFLPIAGSSFTDSGTTRTHGPPPARTTTTFAITSDATVDQARPTTRLGSSASLLVDGDTGTGLDRWAYLKATVSGVSGHIDRAALRLWVSNPTTDGPRAYATSNAWSGATITWANRPATIGPAVSDAQRIPTGAWVDLDVTPLIKGPGTYSFALVPTSADGLTVDSLQGTHKPRLIIETIPTWTRSPITGLTEWTSGAAHRVSSAGR